MHSSVDRSHLDLCATLNVLRILRQDRTDSFGAKFEAITDLLQHAIGTPANIKAVLDAKDQSLRFSGAKRIKGTDQGDTIWFGSGKTCWSASRELYASVSHPYLPD